MPMKDRLPDAIFVVDTKREHTAVEEAQVKNIPIIGLGGIASAEDAIEFFLAGASMVAIGTAIAKDPLLVRKVNAGIEHYLRARGLTSVSQLTGQLELNTDTVLCS